MKTYSIKDIERLSGIKAHTLRIWEKRYGIIEPQRTEANRRCYSNDELRKVLNIAILNNYGLKISQIAELSEQEMHERIIKISHRDDCDEVQVENLIAAMVNFDHDQFHKTITHCTGHYGFEESLKKIIYPFYLRVGALWQAGTIKPAEEHFISHLIRQKMIATIDQLPETKHPKPKTFLFFLPEDEYHELGLLFYDYLVQKAGHKSIYLGQSIPIQDAATATETNKVDYVMTSCLSQCTGKTMSKLVEKLRANFADQQIIITNHIAEENLPKDLNRIITNKKPDEINELLT
jgi:DNA-binding transcriptional MerR regulator